jgi:hypothetical protein
MKREKLRQLAKKISRSNGDALEAERVIAQARSVGRVLVVAGTSRHRIQEVSLAGNVLCVIDRAFRLKEPQLKLR